MHNPRAKLFLEAITVESEDVKDTEADWLGADSLTGFTTLPSGGVRLTGSGNTKVSYATGTNDAITSLPGLSAATVGCVFIEWSLSDNARLHELTELTARLDPNADGSSGVDVDTYVAQLFRVARVTQSEFDSLTQVELEPISVAVTVDETTETGGSVGEVTFSFPGILPQIGESADTSDFPDSPTVGVKPTTVVVIAAYDINGNVASNVAWIGNTATSQVTASGHQITRYNLLEIDNPRTTQTVNLKNLSAATNGVPRFSLAGRTYSQASISFTGSNAPTLDATPTGTVEFILEQEEPGGSNGQGYVRNNGSTTWVAFTDGQTVADLAGVSSTGPQYEMRWTATPSTAGNIAPIAYRLGVRELAREVVSDIAQIGNPVYQLDPFSLKASIPALQFQIVRDGVQDYRDYATELFSDNHPGSLEFRVWYGSTSFDRADWMLCDQFRLNNYEAGGESIVVDCIHPLVLTKKTIPVGSTSGQTAVVFEGSTDTAVTIYEDILETAGVPDRYRGVLLASTSTENLGKTISQPRPAKEELDRVAFIEGGAVIPSGGRLKFKRIWGTTGRPYGSPTEFFDNIAPISVSPNLDRRIISYRVPYGYNNRLDDGRGGFAGASFVQSTAAISKLGHADLEPVQELDTETAQYLPDNSGYGSVIARRTVSAFRQGAVMIRFRADSPRPWVELGDRVEVRTDRFVGRGLESDRALRGRLGVLGTVVEHDLQGYNFGVWVQDIENARTAPVGIEIDYSRPEVQITAVRAEAAGVGSSTMAAAFVGDQLFEQIVTVTPNYDCKRIQFSLGPTGQYTVDNSTSGSVTFTQNQYYWTDFTPGQEFDHRLRAVVSNNYASSTDDTKKFRLQQTSTGVISDIEDANDQWVPLDNLSLWVRPYSSTDSSAGASGPRKVIELAPLKRQTSAGEYTDGTDTYYAGRLRVGAGLSLSRTTDGDIQIALST